MPVDHVRNSAVDVLFRVFEKGDFLDHAVEQTVRRRKLSGRGRRFFMQLVYGTTRHRLLCDHILNGLLDQPLDKVPKPVLCVLRMALFQSLFCDNVTHPAMVHTSVDLAKKRGHAGLARLTNAVLRRAPQSLDQVVLPDDAGDPIGAISIRYSTPRWILERWAAEHGLDTAREIAAASNEEAAFSIRVNTLRTTPGQLRDELLKQGFLFESHTAIPEDLTLVSAPKKRDGASLFEMPAFRNGLFFVQDPASMAPPHLLELEAGQTVLDLCAAPGGKATHMAQLTGDKGRVVAVDASPSRLRLVRQNAARLGLQSIDTVAASGTMAPFTGLFDRVLVDAPCSGLGTLRRHPDIKWRVKPTDLAELAGLQRNLLRSATALCKNGGLIAYSVCTFSPEETSEVIRKAVDEDGLILENGPDWLEQWKIETGQYRILPGKAGLDGFFLTRLRKGC